MRAAGDSELKVYGIFGYPLGHTVSPAIQNCAFDYYRLKSVYFAFERSPARFRYLMRNLKSLILNGFNVTVPHKGIFFSGSALRYLDGVTPDARAIRAVNTVYRKGRRWIGANTDCIGFVTSLKKEGRFNPRGKKILLLGAGGSARAVVYGLARGGARQIWLASRRSSPRERIIVDFKRRFPGTSFDGFSLKEKKPFRKAVEAAQLVINATSVGVLFESKPLIPSSLIPRARNGERKLFFDLVYHKPTRFLRLAEKKGHRVLDGKAMLVYQGAKAFELWTGKRAPVREMKKAMHDALIYRR